MGRQNAEAIVEVLPQFERFTDAALKTTLEEANTTFAEALRNVNMLLDGNPFR